MVSPIVRSSTFLQHPQTHELTDAGRWDEALVYSRYGNPTVEAVESKIAELEGAERALLFGSGVAALHAAFIAATPPGGHIAMASQIYGGTRAILLQELAPLGFEVSEFDLSRPDTVDPRAQAIVVESLSNPTLIVADLPQLAERAKAQGATLIVDATFATPIVQRPLELGADLVVHSATKAMGGHSDLTAGVVAGSDERVDRARLVRKRLGAILDPAPASLLERGLKTLALRVRAQQDAALTLARALEAHPKVTAVNYPGLESHADHALGGQVLAGGGSVLSFVHSGGDGALRECVSRLTLAIDAPSLGGVETVVSLPVFMSHVGLNDEERERAGIVPGLVRVACGIEDPADLVGDFEEALS